MAKKGSELIGQCLSRNFITTHNHTVAQHFFCRLLNAAYDIELVELDNIEENFPAIDLGDTKKRIAFQVTTQKDSAKVTKTLHKFTQHQIHKQFDTLKILVIGARQKTYDAVEIPDQLKFSTTDDILDITGLLKYIGGLDTAHLEAIQKILAEEMTSQSNLLRHQDPAITHISGQHNAIGMGQVTGLDIQGPAIIGPGTISTAIGYGNVTGTRIGPPLR